MKKQLKSINVLIICSIYLYGCATYHLSTQSLLEQFANTQTEKKVNVIIAPPFFFFPGIVKGNNLREIKCLDITEKECVFPITNRTAVKITKKDSSRTTFYFDTLIIQDSTITGCKSHFIGMKIKPVKLAEINKIEIQK